MRDEWHCIMLWPTVELWYGHACVLPPATCQPSCFAEDIRAGLALSVDRNVLFAPVKEPGHGSGSSGLFHFASPQTRPSVFPSSRAMPGLDLDDFDLLDSGEEEEEVSCARLRLLP